MIISAQNIIVIIGLIGILAAFGAVGLFIYHVVTREKKLIEKEKKAKDLYQDIIDKANKEAEEILRKTTLTSENLFSGVKTTNENIAADLDKILQKTAEKHIKTLANDVAMFKKEYEDKIMQIQQTIDQDIKKNLEEFSKSIFSKTSNSAQMIDNKTKELLAKAQKEIEDYKQAEIAKIDKKIMQLTQQIYLQVLGEAIPPEKQQELILRALELGKKDGIFNI